MCLVHLFLFLMFECRGVSHTPEYVLPRMGNVSRVCFRAYAIRPYRFVLSLSMRGDGIPLSVCFVCFRPSALVFRLSHASAPVTLPLRRICNPKHQLMMLRKATSPADDADCKSAVTGSYFKSTVILSKFQANTFNKIATFVSCTRGLSSSSSITGSFG